MKEVYLEPKKYEFTGKTKKRFGRTLYQIRRIADGEVGGWIEKESNLSHTGDIPMVRQVTKQAFAMYQWEKKKDPDLNDKLLNMTGDKWFLVAHKTMGVPLGYFKGTSKEHALKNFAEIYDLFDPDLYCMAWYHSKVQANPRPWIEETQERNFEE